MHKTYTTPVVRIPMIAGVCFLKRTANLCRIHIYSNNDYGIIAV